VCTYPTIRVSTGAGVVAEDEGWTAQAANQPRDRGRRKQRHTAAASTAQTFPSRCFLYLRPPPPSPPLPRRRSPATKPPSPPPSAVVQEGSRAAGQGSSPFPSVGALRDLPGRPALPRRPGITAAARGAPAMQVEPHGGRGALPSAGGSPSDLLFLAGGGRFLVV
jgi:hypothetical protein